MELLTELELWLLDWQLEGFDFSVITVIALGIICTVLGYLGLRIYFWRTRVDVANQLLGSASFIFPPPTVRLKAVVVGALIVGVFWYLLK